MEQNKKKTDLALISIYIILVIIVISLVVALIGYLFIEESIGIGAISISVISMFALVVVALKRRTRLIELAKRELLQEVIDFLHIPDWDTMPDVDTQTRVKSRQTLEKYDEIAFFKEYNCIQESAKRSNRKAEICSTISSFLNGNIFENRKYYDYVKQCLIICMEKTKYYRIQVLYISSAGNLLGEKIIKLNNARVQQIAISPELLMSKGEFNKLQKEKNKEQLENKKRDMYSRVNTIIDRGNNSKDKLIIKSNSQKMDDLITKLFDRTVNSIQKIKDINSEEWGLIDTVINSVDNDTKAILEEENQLCSYYNSESFIKLKETCDKLMQSQKDFNEYIEEKANSISQLFGTRVVRNETQNDDVYNYVRAYKKSITPFTAEVSSTVFSSAENDPIGYVIKYFYPNKTQYKEQVEKLRVLISELETLKEAKIIIDNYKKDYSEYIKDVPSYVLEKDESGFYSRLGFAVIDESVLAIEYKFAYTSDGGMAHRSFTIPMSEENIIELINQLESKLSLTELAKEQRALMTTKLRQAIKERDHFTCCQCGNSTQQEPNLLLEIDHIIPIAKGGLTRVDNLQTLCWKCNRSKGAKIMA